MNKKLLLQQNSQLFDKLHKTEAANRYLKQQITSLNANIAKFEKELDELKNQTNTENSVEFVDSAPTSSDIQPETVTVCENPPEQIQLSDEIEYGSAAIGEIVVKAALCSNKLKELAKPNIKELLNLILGRTEVSKGEILTIVSSETSFDAKKQMVDSLKEEVFEYFNSVLEQ